MVFIKALSWPRISEWYCSAAISRPETLYSPARALLFVTVLLFSPLSASQSEPWLDTYPSVEKVKAKIHGYYVIDSQTRQHAALITLAERLDGQASGQPPELVPESRKLSGAYRAASQKIYLQVEQESDGRRWKVFQNKTMSLQSSEEFQSEVDGTFFSKMPAPIQSILEWIDSQLFLAEAFFANLSDDLTRESGGSRGGDPGFIASNAMFIFFLSIVTILVARILNKLVYGASVPFRKDDDSSTITPVGNGYYRTSYMPSEHNNAGGAGLLVAVAFGVVAFTADASTGLDRLVLLLTIPTAGVAAFSAWRFIKFGFLIGVVAALLYAGYEFVIDG